MSPDSMLGLDSIVEDWGGERIPVCPQRLLVIVHDVEDLSGFFFYNYHFLWFQIYIFCKHFLQFQHCCLNGDHKISETLGIA